MDRIRVSGPTRQAAFFVLVLILALGSLGAQSAPTQNVISWKAVAGAAAYQVEIRDMREEILVTRTVDEPRLTFTLEPGEYEVRITSLNKFRKPASRSGWSKLSIKRAIDPKPSELSPSVLYSGASGQELSVSGEGLIPQTSLSLEGPGGTAAGAILSAEEGILRARFDLSALKPGEYRLKVANPQAEEAWAGPVTLKERVQPSIASISGTEFLNDRVSRGIVVEGSGLDADTVAEFAAPDGTLSRADVELLGPGKLGLTWNSGQLPAGKWSLSLTNPGGLSTRSGEVFTLKDALANPELASASGGERVVEKIVEVPVDRIVEKIVEVPVETIVERIVEVPVETIVERIVEVPVEGTTTTVEKIVEVPVDRIVEVPVEKIVERTVEVPVERIVEVPIEVVVERVVEVPVDREVRVPVKVPVGGSGGISLLAGWSPAMGGGEFDQIFLPSFLSGNLAFQADLGNGFLNVMPAFNFLAFELGANYGEYKARDSVESILPLLRLADIHGVLVARSHFPIPLQLSARAGIGATFSWLSKESPFAAAPVTEFSQDFSLGLGASLILELPSGFAAELLFEYAPLFYSSVTFDTFRATLRTGWRWSPERASDPRRFAQAEEPAPADLRPADSLPEDAPLPPADDAQEDAPLSPAETLPETVTE